MLWKSLLCIITSIKPPPPPKKKSGFNIGFITEQILFHEEKISDQIFLCIHFSEP